MMNTKRGIIINITVIIVIASATLYGGYQKGYKNGYLQGTRETKNKCFRLIDTIGEIRQKMQVEAFIENEDRKEHMRNTIKEMDEERRYNDTMSAIDDINRKLDDAKLQSMMRGK